MHSLVANRAAEVWTTLLSCILQFPARNHGPVLLRRWTYHCTWYQINFSRYPGHLGSTHYENHCPLEMAPLVLAVWWVQRLQDHSHVKLPPVRERNLSCESWPAWSRGFTWKLRVCSVLGAALFCFKKRESKHPPHLLLLCLSHLKRCDLQTPRCCEQQEAAPTQPLWKTTGKAPSAALPACSCDTGLHKRNLCEETSLLLPLLCKLLQLTRALRNQQRGRGRIEKIQIRGNWVRHWEKEPWKGEVYS